AFLMPVLRPSYSVPNSPDRADGDRGPGQVVLDLADGVGAVVDHAGDERRVGEAVGEDETEVLAGPRTAGGDHRDPDRLADQAGEVDLVAVARAVGVDGVEADLSRAERFGPVCPGQGVEAGALASALH